MNPLVQLKKAAPMFVVALVCFGVLPTMQALSPPPDGGYPGGNTAEGQAALLSLTTGGFNTAVGFSSLRSDTTFSFNTAIGAGALFANTADQNTATGAGALLSNTAGGQNTANGAFALISNTGGNANTAIGASTLQFNTTGTLNTALGVDAGLNVTTANNVICIGALVDGADVSNTTWIGNIYNTTTVSGTTLPVIVSDGSQLGTVSSSRRFKKEIKPMDKASEAILALKPVTFHYKSDNCNTPQFGLIAEEVAQVNPDLVVRDGKGEIYTVRYDAVNTMLLNEFLKAHSKALQQEAAITQLKKDFGATIAQLTAQLKEQAAQIQKVSAQLEASKAAPQTVLNDQ